MATNRSKSNQICYVGARIEELMKHYPHGLYSDRLEKILEEFVNGFHFVKNYGLAASVFGSARSKPSDKIYKEAYDLAQNLVGEGFAIITGGGPGVMEAANKGAYDAGGRSAGLNIQLAREQETNPYVKESESFHYFFVRKVMLAFASEVYIFFPGGFGTLDELFELIMLVQTKKIEPIPIILVDKEYWSPLLVWIESVLSEKNSMISKGDIKIYHLVDNAEEGTQLIKKMLKKGNTYVLGNKAT